MRNDLRDPDPFDDLPDPRLREMDVPVVPLGARGSSRRGAIAAVLVTSALTALIAAGSLFPVRPPPIASPVDVPLGTPAATGAPGPADTPRPMPLRGMTPRLESAALDVSALVAGVRDGTFAGRLVFLAGRIHATPRSCRNGAALSACITLSIDGLRGLQVIPDDAIGAWSDDPGPGSALVLEDMGGRLVYLGSVVVDPAGIPGIDVLTGPDPIAPPGSGPGPTLVEVDGWLVSAAPCGEDTTSCPQPAGFLAPTGPGDGLLGMSGGVPVIAPPRITDFGRRATWWSGPFLVRHSAAWDCGGAVDRHAVRTPRDGLSLRSRTSHWSSTSSSLERPRKAG